MAGTFDEFLKEQQKVGATNVATAAPAPESGSFSDFLQKNPGGEIPVAPAAPAEAPQKPFLEREGILQTIVRPAYKLGQDIGYWLNKQEFDETRTSIEQDAKDAAEQLKNNPDMPDRMKTVLMRIVDQSPQLLDDIKPPTTEQVVGDIAGTALLVATPASFLRGIGTGVAAQLVRGGIAGGSIAGASALSENKSFGEAAEDTAIGAIIGAPIELFGGVAAKFAKDAVKKGVGGLVKFSPVRAAVDYLAESSPVKFITSVGQRLQQFGDNGRAIFDKINNIDTATLKRTGKFMVDSREAGLFNLTQNEAYQLQDLLEGRAVNDVSPRVQKAFDVADSLRNEIGFEAEAQGLQVRLRRGVSVPFRSQNNYFPHLTVSLDDITNETQLYQQAVENAVRVGRFASKEEAAQFAKSYADYVAQNGKGNDYWVRWLVNNGQTTTILDDTEKAALLSQSGRLTKQSLMEHGVSDESAQKIQTAMDEARGMALRYFKQSRLVKSASLEHAREIDFPLYDPDPRRVLPKYAMGAYNRLEVVAEFGIKGEVITKALGRINRIQGPEAGREAAQIVNIALDAVKSSPAAEKASVLFRMLQVPKLAFSQIINLGQSITNTTLASDLPTLIRGYRAAFSDNGIQLALKSGATLESIIQEMTSRNGANNAFSARFLKWTGFTATERFNRTVAANTGAIYAGKTVGSLLKDPTSKVMRQRLTELGLDPEVILQRGYMTQSEGLTAAKIFSDRTQFRSRPIDLPAFASSPAGKVFFQFKNFSYNQARFLKDEFKSELQLGNYGRAVRNVAVLALLFPITGEVLADVQSLATGSKRPTPALDRYFDDLANAGGLGLMADTLKSASNGRLAASILGPTVSQAVGNVEALTQGLTDGKLTKTQKRFLINQFGITRPIGNWLYEPDIKTGETFLESLREMTNE